MATIAVRTAAAAFILSTFVALYAQQTQPPTTVATVPRLVRINSVFRPANGLPAAPVESVTLSIYKDDHDLTPLWQETQNVALDADGRYTVLMGSSLAEGMPLDLFSAAEPRWLGVQFNRPGESEQPRVLLVSVPYALKAADADTLGGRPASAYLLSPDATTQDDESGSKGARSSHAAGPLKTLSSPPISAVTTSGVAGCLPKFLNTTDLGCSIMTENNGLVGVGTGNPLDRFHSQFNDSSGAVTGYAVQNLGSGAASYSGMLFYDQNGALGQFQGFNNLTHEYRINNIASGGSINFMIGSSSKFLVGNNGNIGIGTQTGTAKLNVKANTSFTGTGTVSITSGTSTLTGVGTKFLTELNVGDRIQFVQTGQTVVVFTITSDTSATVGIASSSVTASAITVFPALVRMHNSSGGLSFQVNDAGSVSIGGGLTSSTLKLWVLDGNRFSGTSAATQMGIGNVLISTNTAQGADVGGILALGGSRGSTGISSFAGLRGGKENSTDADSAGYLGLYTTNGASTFAERMRVTSSGMVGIGTKTPSRELEVAGGVRLNTPALQPTCDATTRGTFWVTQGGAGVKDSVEVCAKDASDAYAWRTLY